MSDILLTWLRRDRGVMAWLGVVLCLGWLAPDTTAQTLPRIRLSAEQVQVSAGSAHTVDVLIESVTNLGSFQFNLVYDPEMVEIKAIQLGDFLGSTGRQPNPLGPRTDRPGDTVFGAFTLGNPDQRGPDGAGRLATVQVTGKKAGVTALRLDRIQATTPLGQPIALATATGATGVAPTQPAQTQPAVAPTPRPAIPTAVRPPVASPTPPDPLPPPAQTLTPLIVGLAAIMLIVVILVVRRLGRR